MLQRSQDRAASPKVGRHRAQNGESGDILLSWLGQILLVLAVIGIVVYETLSIAITSVRLDDSAREVALAARDAYRGEVSLTEAAESAEEVAAAHGVTVIEIVTDGADLVLELEKRAPTVLVHRIGPLEDLVTATTSSRIRWAP